MENHNLVFVYYDGFPHLCSNGLGFVYDRFENGTVVICTCRHLFGPDMEASMEYVRILASAGMEHEYQPVHAESLFSPDNRDIAFIVCVPVKSAPSVALYDIDAHDHWQPPPIAGLRFGLLQSLSLAIVEEDSCSYVGPTCIWVCPNNPSPQDGMLCQSYTVVGWHKHGIVNIQSDAGTSGSPLFDADRRLIGMINGGRSGSGNYTVFIYAGDIRRAYRQLHQRIAVISARCNAKM